MYVKDWTRGYGDTGRRAVQLLLDRGSKAGIIAERVVAEFVDGDTNRYRSALPLASGRISARASRLHPLALAWSQPLRRICELDSASPYRQTPERRRRRNPSPGRTGRAVAPTHGGL
jgi:hypothetical protein